MALSPIPEQSTKPMSIWTNSALILACAGLGACAGMDFASPNRGVSVLGGAVQVTPPAGYCANPKVSTAGADSAVVLMGRCNANASVVPALMTASIGAAGSGAALDAGPVALTSFFTSDQGRGMLASTGKASDAAVKGSQTEGNAVVLLIEDRQFGPYWRAILPLKGRLVMLSATGADNIALKPEDGRALISKAMASLARANPEPTAKGEVLATLTATAPTQAQTQTQEAAPLATALRPKARPKG